MTRGGDVVNAIPDHAELETYVRSSNVEAMVKAAKAVDRAFVGGAVSMGCECRISSKGGYMPTMVSKELTELCSAVIPAVTARRPASRRTRTARPTWRHLDPHAGHAVSVGGSEGDYHGKSIRVPDDSREAMYLNGGRVMAAVAYELLKDGGKKALEIKAAYKPEFASPAEYMALADSFYADKIYRIEID